MRRPCFTPALVAAACSLSVAAAHPQAPASVRDRPPSIDASVTVSSADGADAAARLAAAGAELRLWASMPPWWSGGASDDGTPEACAGVAVPYVRLGATRLAGLAAFVYRPAAAGPLLLGVSGAPLRLDGPADAGWIGASLGEDFGLFAARPRRDGERPSYGAWLSPRGGRGSAMVVAACEPAGPGGPSWYDVPAPPSDRFWAAAAAGAGGGSWAVAAAGAAGSGFPGRDYLACRAEGRFSAGHLRAEVEASAANAGWRGPDGGDAPAFRLDTGLVWSKRGLLASGGYRCVIDDADDAAGAATAFRGSASVNGPPGFASAAATLSPDPAGAAPAMEVDARFRPGFMRWLTLSSSWKASEGEARRLDLIASADLGGAVRLRADSGLRLVPEGRLARASCAVSLRLRSAVVEAGVRTDGWVGTAGPEPDPPECWIRVTAAIR